MYILSDDQLASVKSFIDKLDESLIKSRVQRWFDKIKPERVLSEEMEEFVGFATHLPKEVQDYPQAFAFAVKNGDETPEEAEDEGEESEEPKKPKKVKKAAKVVTKKK